MYFVLGKPCTSRRQTTWQLGKFVDLRIDFVPGEFLHSEQNNSKVQQAYTTQDQLSQGLVACIAFTSTRGLCAW